MSYVCNPRTRARRRRQRLLDTIYYKNPNPDGDVTWIYADDPAVGLQSSTYNQVTNESGSMNLSGQSFFFNIAQLVTGSDSQRSVTETFSYTNTNVSSKVLFVATSQFVDAPAAGTTLTTVPSVTFAVTGGLGRFARANKAVINFDNVTGMRTVRVYA